MRLPIFLVCALAAGALGGCARYYWSKPGTTAEQFSRDSGVCASEASASVGISAQRAYRLCLTMRGYVRDEQRGAASPGSYRALDDEGFSLSRGFPGAGLAPRSTERQLEQLDVLRQFGRIDDAEYEVLRQRVLDLSTPAASAPALPPGGGR